MKQSAKFGLVLGITCFMATLILSLTYEITRTRIESRSESEEASALKKIMPDADDFRKNSVSGIEYFEATKNGQTVGYCVRAVGNGYGGYIKMIFGIDRSGIIKGLEILEQSETPGLGSKIVEISSGDMRPYFTEQFKGRQARAVVIGREIDAITGATISSKAVTDAVSKTADEFLEKIKK